MHVLYDILPGPKHDRQMLVDYPVRILIVGGKLITKILCSIRAFTLLSLKEQFGCRASTGFDGSCKFASSPSNLNIVCPAQRKTTSKTTTKCTQAKEFVTVRTNRTAFRLSESGFLM